MKFHLFEANYANPIIIEAASNDDAMRAAGLRSAAIGEAIYVMAEVGEQTADNGKSYVSRRLT